MWLQEEAGLTVMLADDWSRNKVQWGGGLDVPFKLLVVGRSAPTVSGSGLWVRRVLVSGVLVGGEGGEGRGRRQRQRAGLRAEASCRRGVRRRPRDTDSVAAAVGGICYPGNKKLLWGSVRLHPSFPLEWS